MEYDVGKITQDLISIKYDISWMSKSSIFILIITILILILFIILLDTMNNICEYLKDISNTLDYIEDNISDDSDENIVKQMKELIEKYEKDDT